MTVDDATMETIINVIKERPELLRNINVAIAEVLVEAGISKNELGHDEILEIISTLLVDETEQEKS